MPWGRAAKHTFNGICRGFCTPSFPKLYFFEKSCLYPNFFSSVANRSTLFFLRTYWYAWLNNCGLRRPLMRVFTRPQMKPLHHVHSLSICCVPATLLCPRCFFPRILRVNSERQCLTCSNFKGRRRFFAALSQLRHPSVRFFSNFGQQLACQNFTHTFYRRLCAAGNKFQWSFLEAKAIGATLCHSQHANVAQKVGWQQLSWMFYFPLFDPVLEGDRILSDPVFSQQSCVHFYQQRWVLSRRIEKCIGFILQLKVLSMTNVTWKTYKKCSKDTDSIEVYVVVSFACLGGKALCFTQSLASSNFNRL